ncbi:MAG: hypothetical protein U9R74_20345 [Pseudomonadota bacterium]|nr:hypothetical protein [Pseudomonadota bacterium]
MINKTFIAAVLAFTGIAHAGGSVSMRAGGNTADSGDLGFEYSGSGDARFDFQETGSDGYLLISNGSAYMVSGHGGDIMIMDMAEIGKMAQAFRQNMPRGAGGAGPWKGRHVDGSQFFANGA